MTDGQVGAPVDLAVASCISLLEDDYARQGNYLSIDDVNRLVLRRQLPAEKVILVLDRLKANGVHLTEDVDRRLSPVSELPENRAHDDHALTTAPTLSLGRHALLSSADEVRLARRYQASKAIGAGSLTADSNEPNSIVTIGRLARAELILCNIRLVMHYAKKRLRTSSLSEEDLVQEGILGLCRAIETWEPEKGFRFSTYASWWIMQTIDRAILNRDRLVRIPTHIEARISKLRKKRRRLSAALGREPTVEELARDLGWPLADIHFVTRVHRDVQSLDHDCPPDTLYTIRAHSISHTDSPSFNAEKREMDAAIEAVLNTLDNRSRKIVALRFGLLGHKPRTLEQIGRRYGISRERVRQIEKKALEKLARPFRSAPLKPYLPEGRDV